MRGLRRQVACAYDHDTEGVGQGWSSFLIGSIPNFQLPTPQGNSSTGGAEDDPTSLFAGLSPHCSSSSAWELGVGGWELTVPRDAVALPALKRGFSCALTSTAPVQRPRSRRKD